MLRMIEVTESSHLGYSDAVTAAIKKVIESGEKVHYIK
jgi:hypothetical protein